MTTFTPPSLKTRLAEIPQGQHFAVTDSNGNRYGYYIALGEDMYFSERSKAILSAWMITDIVAMGRQSTFNHITSTIEFYAPGDYSTVLSTH